MRNIRIEVEYLGTNYCGWQIQNCRQPPEQRKKSIQEVLEETLQKILQEKVKVIGSGRTDSGVHALFQVANFKTSTILSLKTIQRALNGLLAIGYPSGIPHDISVKKISEAALDFHSCRSAKSKIYKYFIFNAEYSRAFYAKFSWYIPHKLNIGLMRSESKTLIGRHDFKSFCASNSSAKTTVRNIKNISVTNQYYDLLGSKSKLIAITIEAEGFLYNMARNIAGTLAEAGRGRFKKGYIRQALLARDRKFAGPTAPAHGLFLAKVNY